MKARHRIDYCPTCDGVTDHSFEPPFAGSREEPPDRGGWFCEECGNYNEEMRYRDE